MQRRALRAEIRRIGMAAGLDAIGFAAADPFSTYALRDSPRRDPRMSLPGARAIIVAGVYIGALALPVWENPCWGRTSRLYLSGFFLDVVEPLQPIVELLENTGHKAVICDGAAPGGSILPLKLAAVRAGLGWQGKHSLLISKAYGTFLALGGIVTDAELATETQREPNRCKRCDLCQTACPLGALEQPHVLNRERCLSYQLQAEALSSAARMVMGNRVGDCEICQIACPWNRRHLLHPLKSSRNADFQEQVPTWERVFRLTALAELSEAQYRSQLGPLGTQIPYRFFRRNVQLALAHAAGQGCG
ncbi:MAG: 4Fe-4S double cluster binding domain-containing protein [Desulfosarcinaceae bacterium]|nr:4Fe-4S double cluster binding domain-containing protein [Desulfosarcinaceae bacterium]